MKITAPWITRDRSPQGHVAVMASRFELTSGKSVPRFMFLAVRAYLQALRAPGVVGVTLKAAPWKGTFWTLSAWADQKAIATYSRSEPHAGIAASLGPVTSTSRFVFFDLPAAVKPTWDDALLRLAVADQQATSTPPPDANPDPTP